LRKRNLEKVQGILFDAVFAIGLPWLVELTGTPLVRMLDLSHRLGDVNLAFQPTRRGDRPLGLSFCNHEPGPLNHRLDRVKKQWDEARGADLGALVVLRFAEARTTPKNEERLKALAASGARVIRVDRQQLAELAAFQTLLTKSLEGDLTRHGRLVDPSEYGAW